MKKFDMDFNEIKPVATIEEATVIDKETSFHEIEMECAQLEYEISHENIKYQQFALEAYINADGNKELYDSEIAIVSESFKEKAKKLLTKAWNTLIELIDKLIKKFKEIRDRFKKFIKEKKTDLKKAKVETENIITIKGLHFDGWDDKFTSFPEKTVDRARGFYNTIHKYASDLIERPTDTMYNESLIDFNNRKLDSFVEEIKGDCELNIDISNQMQLCVSIERTDTVIQDIGGFLAQTKLDMKNLQKTHDSYGFSNRDEVKKQDDGEVYADNIMDAYNWYAKSVSKIARILKCVSEDYDKIFAKVSAYAYQKMY